MTSPAQPIGVVVANGADPCLRVAGLPLAVRAIIELSRAGIEEVVLVVADEGVGEALVDDGRIDIPVRIATVAPPVDRPSVTVPADTAAHRDVYRALVERARHGESVTLAAGETAGWVFVGGDSAGNRQIVRELFEGCRKPVDGIVSRHLNRHVSIFFSKRLVNIDVSPNAITVLTFFLGIAAMLVTARASYGMMIAGAALLQLNSILDGVDGELARVRYQGSKLGQWLDTVCDDLANTMFYGGVAYAAFVTPTLPEYLGWCGAGAVVGSSLTMLMYYTELVRLGSGDFYALDVGQDVERTGLWAALNRGVRYATKRDFFVFSFLVAAVIGVLPWMLPIMAAGTLATVITGLKITLARLRRPAA